MTTHAELDHAGRRLGTLERCALHRRTVSMTCPACGWERRFDAVALWWMFARRGWDDGLPRVWRRFRCEGCWFRDGRVVRPRAAVTRDPPDADQPTYPDQASWKRLVSRYRS